MTLIEQVLRFLKKIPLDLGQENMNQTTTGKKIALSLVPLVPLHEKRKRTALDVGCRKGYQTRLLEKMGYAVTPIDVEKVFDRCVVVDANKKLPFADTSFDLIWCSEVIEHLAAPVFTVNEFRRILKPGGKMVLTTPNSYFWLMKPFHWVGLSPKKLQRKDHTQFFHEKDIRRIFPNAAIYGFFPYMLVKVTIDKLLGPLTPTFVISERKSMVRTLALPIAPIATSAPARKVPRRPGKAQSQRQRT